MTKVQAVLLYGVLPEYDIITRSVRIANGGPDRIYVNKAASACLDFLDGEYDMISFYGATPWSGISRERPSITGNRRCAAAEALPAISIILR